MVESLWTLPRSPISPSPAGAPPISRWYYTVSVLTNPGLERLRAALAASPAAATSSPALIAEHALIDMPADEPAGHPHLVWTAAVLSGWDNLLLELLDDPHAWHIPPTDLPLWTTLLHHGVAIATAPTLTAAPARYAPMLARMQRQRHHTGGYAWDLYARLLRTALPWAEHTHTHLALTARPLGPVIDDTDYRHTQSTTPPPH